MEVLDQEKTNSLFNLLNHKLDLCAKDPYEGKYQFLINKRESIGLRYLNDSKAFVEYLDNMDDIYKSIGEYNLNKKQKLLIVFGDMIADMHNNKKT